MTSENTWEVTFHGPDAPQLLFTKIVLLVISILPLLHCRSYLVSKENIKFSAARDFAVSEGEVPSLSLLRVLDLTTDAKQWHKLINGRAHQT